MKKWNRAGMMGLAALLTVVIQAGAAGETARLAVGRLNSLVNVALECSVQAAAPMPRIAESPMPESPAPPEPEKPAPQAKIYASPQEISMIEHVVEREVHGASYSHKIAIANVIVNRVLEPRFPGTVTDVVHAPNQFPISIKNYYNPKWKPDADTINAVYAAIYEPDTTGGALYFYAPQYTKKKTAGWFENKLQYCFAMEGHRFFR